MDTFSCEGLLGRAPSSVKRTNAVILNENGKNGGSRRRIKEAATGDPNVNVDWAIVEGTIESLSDADVVDLYADNVAWTFIPRDDAMAAAGELIDGAWNHKGHHPSLNFKTRAEWTALLPNDYIISGLITPVLPRTTLNGVGI
jgi:hypothetical protein